MSAAPPARRRVNNAEVYRLAVETSEDLISVFDLTGKTIFSSSSHERLTGFSTEESVALGWEGVVHPDDLEVARKAFERAFLGEPSGLMMLRVRHRDGGWRVIEGNATLVSGEDGRPRYVVSHSRDVTERERANAERQESETLLELALEASKMGMWEVDLGSNELVWSSTTPATTPGADASARRISIDEALERVHPDDRERLRAVMAHALATGESYEIETRAIFPDGSLHWRRSFGHVLRDEAGRPTRHFGLIVDITEEKRAEEQHLQMQAQLQQTQRLEAIGELAGGIAHDFNNLLLAFRGYGELALGKLHESDLGVRADLEHMMTAADRASALTRQLLAFSSRQILQPQVVDLNDVVREEEGLLRRLIGEDIRIVTVLEAGAGCVDADPGQLGQVLMNLALNARHAMPDGGTLTIETGERDLDEQLALALGAVAPGPYLRLTVRDTGVGMDAQTRERAFEPFYTTKPVGQGTGLGLATVYGIVKQSGGCITLDSQPGEGTAFTIYLPRTDAPKHASAQPQRPIPRTGSERILLVEDDESVKTLLTEQLRAQGYTVTDVSDPTQAIELAHDADCDLLITDVVMPEMNGRELAERLVAQRPQLKVIYMSGYTDQAIVERGILIQDINFLQKPFDSTEMVTKVRDVLDAP